MAIQTLDLSVEERLAAMEAAIADLQRQVGLSREPGNWLEQITGAFKDDPVFEKMLRYGREYRESTYPDFEFGIAGARWRWCHKPLG
jgi:hypothetical protein